MRGSSHIRAQKQLLADEAQRTGLKVESPTDWIIDREMREYDLCDVQIVLSRFAQESFLAQGASKDRVQILTPGIHKERFGANEPSVVARRDRIETPKPLNVLYVGLVTARKGLWDLVTVPRRLSKGMSFRAVGGIDKSCKGLVHSARPWIDFRGNLPESRATRPLHVGRYLCVSHDRRWCRSRGLAGRHSQTSDPCHY